MLTVRQTFLYLLRLAMHGLLKKEKNLEKLLHEADEAMYENKKELKKER